MFSYAIARKPGEDFSQGITTVQSELPSYEQLIKQHDAYVSTLQSLGLKVIVLEPLLGFPDAYFIEDTAIVTPDVAVITNPGAASRKGEESSVASVLAQYRQVEQIKAPGTLDGGDVLMAENHFFIGISDRTNEEGAEQLGRILEKYGSTWAAVPVTAGLHLKSSVNYVGNNTLLLSQDFADLPEFEKYQKIIVSQAEEYACNTLWVNDRLITPKGFPNTKKELESLGYPIIELEMSEARKMDGGLSCLSLRF